MWHLLEFGSKFGLIDIFFGIGIPAFLWSMIRKQAPRNYPYLHVSVSSGSNVSIPPNQVNIPSISFSISNSGSSNFYIARAYFLPIKRSWKTKFLPTKTYLKVHPYSDRIADKSNAFELKFLGKESNLFTEYETIIRPGHENRKQTWLALAEPLVTEMIINRDCGTLFIEYATKDYQGVHKVRV